ncbi:hypothetical protein D3C81_1208340 [compost metagenome]
MLLVQQDVEGRARAARGQQVSKVVLHLIFTEADIQGTNPGTQRAFGLIAPCPTPTQQIANPTIGQALPWIEPGFDLAPAHQPLELLAACRQPALQVSLYLICGITSSPAQTRALGIRQDGKQHFRQACRLADLEVQCVPLVVV